MTDIDPKTLDTLYTIWMFLNTAIMLFIAVYSWISNRDKVQQSAVKDLDDDVKEVTNRVGQLEEALKHVPNKKELDTIHKRITESSELQQTMQGELKHVSKTLDLIHEFLLKRT